MLARNRKLYERVSKSLGELGLRLGFSPDFWTYAGLALSIWSAFLFARGWLLWGVLSLFVIWFTDVLDGATARALNKQSPFGTVLDHVSDRFAEIIVGMGLLLSGLVAPLWIYVGITGMIMASYVRAKAESRTDVSVNVGLAGRSEKVAILAVGALIQSAHIGTNALQWAFVLVGLVSYVTAIQRLAYTYRSVNPSDIATKDASK